MFVVIFRQSQISPALKILQLKPGELDFVYSVCRGFQPFLHYYYLSELICIKEQYINIFVCAFLLFSGNEQSESISSSNEGQQEANHGQVKLLLDRIEFTLSLDPE